MPPTLATSGYGAKFYLGDGGGPEVFTKISELAAVVPPDKQQETAEATHMESPQRFKEYILTMKDSGEVQLTFNWLPTDSTQALIDAAYDNSRRCNMRIVFYGDTQRIEGQGIITNISRTIPMGDRLTRVVTIKATGPWPQVVHP